MSALQTILAHRGSFLRQKSGLRGRNGRRRKRKREMLSKVASANLGLRELRRASNIEALKWAAFRSVVKLEWSSVATRGIRGNHSQYVLVEPDNLARNLVKVVLFRVEPYWLHRQPALQCDT